VALASGLAIGRRGRPDPSMKEDSRTAQTSTPSGRVSRSSPPVLRLTGATPTCPGNDPEAKTARARQYVSQLLRRLDMIPSNNLFTAESRVNRIRDYVTGVMDAIRQSDPELPADLARLFTDSLCEGPVPDDKAMLLSHMAQMLPAMATNQGFQCFFAQAPEKETPAVWYMIDAWRESGQDKPPALGAIERTARDDRTRMRFLTREQLAAKTGLSSGRHE
jgi:hypothetical protein